MSRTRNIEQSPNSPGNTEESAEKQTVVPEMGLDSAQNPDGSGNIEQSPNSPGNTEEKNIRIQMLKTYASPDDIFSEGLEYSVPKGLANILIKSKAAVSVHNG